MHLIDRLVLVDQVEDQTNVGWISEKRYYDLTQLLDSQ